MSKSKSSTAAQVKNAIDGDNITLTSTIVRDGLRVKEPMTFPIPSLDDLPRSLRRKIRQTQVKYAGPSAKDRSGGRFDVFTLAFEIGEMVAEHHGAHLNLDDDATPIEEADAQDAAITALGMRILASQAKDGGSPNAETPPEDAPTGG